MNEALNEFLKTADPLCAEHDSIVDQLEIVTSDRDIKAANLQLLVEKVLEFGSFAAQFADGPPYDNAGKDADSMWDTLTDLARSLKQ